MNVADDDQSIAKRTALSVIVCEVDGGAHADVAQCLGRWKSFPKKVVSARAKFAQESIEDPGSERLQNDQPRTES